jgi:hypothetical protein
MFLAACGSSDGSAGSAGADDSADTDGGGNDDASTGPAGALEGATFDPSLLPTTPIDVRWLAGSPNERSGPPDPVADLESAIDDCSAIDAATVTEIVSGSDTLGLEYDFTAVPGRASCTFDSPPHAIRLFVNRADDLDEDLIAALNWLGGDVSSRPGGTGDGATLYFEDSFDVVTFFAARAERDGWAAVVTNSGGTGMLESDDEYDGWGDLAMAALANVAGTDPPSGEPGSDTGIGPDPCALYEPGELGAAFGVSLDEDLFDDDETPGCRWITNDEAVVISISVGDPSEGPEWFRAAEATAEGVYRAEFGNGAVVAGDDRLYQVIVVVRRDAYGLESYEFGGVDDRDTQPIVDELVANIIERTS